jgi:isopenicillin N synthase-like dioxygenase
LPQEIKDKVPHPPEGWWHRGYSGLGREKVSQMLFDAESIAEARKIPDQKESFEMGKEDNPKCPNIWLPEEDLPGFRAFFNRFYKICNELELDIFRALALGMDLDENYFVSYHQNADNQTRILHYPPVPEELLRSGKAERIAAHSDFGTITLLFQDQVGGLEIEDPHQEGVFRPVPYIANTVVVNAGDFLKMWTNDVIKSTMHRVRAPPTFNGDHGEGKTTPARYSIPYFCGPDTEKTMECVPTCYGPDRPKKYGPTTVGQYIDMRMNALY